MSEPWREDETVAVFLRLDKSLPLQVRMLERDTYPMPTLRDETLDGIIDLAIDEAAYDGDWQGLVRLRHCLRKWAKEAEDALRELADGGAARDRHPRGAA